MSERSLTFGAAPPIAAATPTRFFPVLALLMAATVIAGFAPTYYFRGVLETYFESRLEPFFGAVPLDRHLHLHGLALSAWYVLFVAQTCLVAAHRVALHRRLGVLAAAVAAAIPVSTWLVDPSSLFLSIPFVALVAAAVALRRKPQAHKRLMTMASIAILTPASGRLAAQVAIAAGVPARWWWLLVAVQFALVSAVLIYDVRSRRRIHAATLVGAPVCLLAVLMAPRA